MQPDSGSTEKGRRVFTFGTFDLLHVGHVSILERARAQGDWLGVGVSVDSMSFDKKGRLPYYSFQERSRIVSALRCVDFVFAEESLALKRHYLEHYRANILVMGDDWLHKFDEFRDICEVVYLSRTPHISTTDIVGKIRGGG